MRKQWFMANVGVGICAVMFFVSGYSPVRANAPGYELYKTALLQTKTGNSFTVNADLSVTDNGTKWFGAQATVKMNRELGAGSVAAVFDDNDEPHSVNVYRQDGKAIIKSDGSDVYKVAEHNDAKWKHDGPPKAMGEIIDKVIGGMWEHAKVDAQADGGKRVTLHLSEAEIAAPVTAAGALMIARAADSGKWGHVPKLTKNAGLQEIRLDAFISPDGRLDRQTVEIVISGSDEAGKHHDVAIQLLAVMSGYDQTIPDRIDLTGKTLESVKADESRHGWKGRGWHK